MGLGPRTGPQNPRPARVWTKKNLVRLNAGLRGPVRETRGLSEFWSAGPRINPFSPWIDLYWIGLKRA